MQDVQSPRSGPTGRDIQRVAFSVLMVAVLAYFVITTFGQSPGARYFPWLVGVPGLLLGLRALQRDIARMRAGEDADADRDASPGGDETTEGADDAEPTGQPDDRPGITGMRERQVLLWLAVLVALIVGVGMVVGIFLFIVAFMRVTARERWRTSVLVGAGTTATIHVIFVELLSGRLYGGLVADEVLPLIEALLTGAS